MGLHFSRKKKSESLTALEQLGVQAAAVQGNAYSVPAGTAPSNGAETPSFIPPPPLTAKPRRTWARRLLIGFNIVLAVVLVAGAAGFGYVKWRFGQVSKIDLGSILDDASSKDPMTILMVGSDSREDLSPAEAKSFGSAKAVAGQRSDTIMLLHVDPKTQQAAILSLPRDLWVPISGTSGKQRINTAFDNGPQQLINTIKKDFNIPIDHYAEVNFDGFKGIVDSIDGVTIRFDAPARDTVSGLNVAQAGCVKLTGDQALAYVRSRHYEAYEGGRWRDDPRSDLSRIDRQQDFIRRVMRKAISKGSTNPVALNSLISNGVKNLTIDNGFGLTDITRTARRFQSLDPNQVQMMTLPTKASTVGGADVLLPQEPDATKTVQQFLNGSNKQEAPAAIPSGSISVRVLNGSGKAGQATETAGGLKDSGFVVAGVGDAKAAATTTIRYPAGNENKAQAIAGFLKGGTTLVQDNTVKGVDAIITTGSSFDGVNVPGATPTTTTTPPTTSPPATTSTTASPFVPSNSDSC